MTVLRAPEAPAALAPPRRRSGALDAARGVAVLAMVAFHLIWDLGHFRYIDASIPFSAPVMAFGHAIAFAFLFIAGVSLALAHRRGVEPRAFWRRLAIVAGAALLVTAATYALFPSAYVFFGILHVIAAASLIGVPFLFLPAPAALITGAAFFAAPHFLAAPAFNAPALQWLGLGTVEPMTVDWRPLFPWAGALLLGLGAARLRDFTGATGDGGGLGFLGRHSLLIYLVHQPLLFALFTALVALAPPPEDPRVFLMQCEAGCRTDGGEKAYCRDVCLCTQKEASKSEALAAATEETERGLILREIAGRCVGRRLD